MAILSVQTLGLMAAPETFVACSAGGDSLPNDGKTYLHFKNTDAAVKTVTINSQTACDQGFDHDITVSVPATTGDVVVGPFSPKRFNDGARQVQMTYSAVTGLTVAAVKMP